VRYWLPLPVGEGRGEGPVARTMPGAKTVGMGRFDARKLFVPLAPALSPRSIETSIGDALCDAERRVQGDRALAVLVVGV